MGKLSNYSLNNYKIAGGSYGLGDILLSNKYISSISAYITPNYTPMYIVIDNNYIFCIDSDRYLYKYDCSNLNFITKSGGFYPNISQIISDTTYIYGLVYNCTTEGGLLRINKSSFNYEWLLRTSNNSSFYYTAFDINSGSLKYILCGYDTSYTPYHVTLSYYYNEQWIYKLLYEADYSANAVKIDGTSLYILRRTGILYKYDVITQQVVLTKDIGISADTNDQMVIINDYIFIRGMESGTSKLFKFDKNGNRVSAISCTGNILAKMSNEYIYVKCGSGDRTLKKIDTNLNVVWEYTYNTNKNIYDVDKYGNFFVISFSGGTTNNSLLVINSQTGNPDISIKIID